MKKGIFPYKGNVFKTKEEERTKQIVKYIENESKSINYDLFKNNFNFNVPSALIRQLHEIENRKKSNELANVIKSD